MPRSDCQSLPLCRRQGVRDALFRASKPSPVPLAGCQRRPVHTVRAAVCAGSRVSETPRSHCQSRFLCRRRGVRDTPFRLSELPFTPAAGCQRSEPPFVPPAGCQRCPVQAVRAAPCATGRVSETPHSDCQSRLLCRQKGVKDGLFRLSQARSLGCQRHPCSCQRLPLQVVRTPAVGCQRRSLARQSTPA